MKYKSRIDIEAKVISNDEGNAIVCQDGGLTKFSCNTNKCGKFGKNKYVPEELRGQRVEIERIVTVCHQGVVNTKEGYRYDNAEIVGYASEERTWKWVQKHFESPEI